MFSQDVANRTGRGASRRKVNFQAAIEDLECRMLLSMARYGYHAVHHPAHIRVAAADPAQDSRATIASNSHLSGTGAAHHATSARHGRHAMARHGQGGALAIATSAPMI